MRYYIMTLMVAASMLVATKGEARFMEGRINQGDAVSRSKSYGDPSANTNKGVDDPSTGGDTSTGGTTNTDTGGDTQTMRQKNREKMVHQGRARLAGNEKMTEAEKTKRSRYKRMKQGRCFCSSGQSNYNQHKNREGLPKD